jgi:hypothetical protein
MYKIMLKDNLRPPYTYLFGNGGVFFVPSAYGGKKKEEMK